MSDSRVRMAVLSTEDLDASIALYEGLGFPVKFRDGSHFAALDGGDVTLALATEDDHPFPGRIVIAIRTDDVDAAAQSISEAGGTVVREPYDDAGERHAVVYDNQGNGLVLCQKLSQ